MFLSFVLLIAAWFFVVLIFHIYSRCHARLPLESQRSCRRHVIGFGGLHPSAVNALPTFVYESKGNEPMQLECVVCLSDLEDGEMGRVMPDCRHCFHVECIDMWLQSHSSCPLCRTRVKARGAGSSVGPVENSHESVVGSGSGSSFGWIFSLPNQAIVV
ncbi:RING/U-box superfamily protein [Striga asiatica]|uniref:RING-type E3 ubiquitin transferase n=1 Tax=Striga asiatica TaxID=4170 RepID=A0A5A7PR25_STRAF|nr:RING/U-box superfamily protein [Striga asiatica]